MRRAAYHNAFIANSLYAVARQIPASFPLFFILLLFVANTASAQVIVPFTQRTSSYSPAKKIYSIRGDFTMIGNTNLTLSNYTSTANNNAEMKYVDVDNNDATLNSSSATLQLSNENNSDPNCSNIIYAGLYWTGRSHDGTSPNEFNVTKNIRSSTPQVLNNNQQVYNSGNIDYTNYTLRVSSGGSSNNVNIYYEFYNNSTYQSIVFAYMNYYGSPILYVIENGSWTEIATSSINTSTAVLQTPYIIYSQSGGIILKVSSFYKNGSNSTISQAYASTNVSGNYYPLITVTKNFDKSVVYLKHASASGYTAVAANDNNFTQNIYYPSQSTSTGDYMYTAYAEVTDYVKQYGIGSYTVADVALQEGDGGPTGYYGGWGMVVIYENSKMNPRDVTLFDGHAYMRGYQTDEKNLTVSGFWASPTGNVNMKLGLMAGEGDVDIDGDYFLIQQLQTTNYLLLSHGGNTTNNFFNSSIYTGGNTRNPNLLNNTGLDISMFKVPNAGNTVIANSQTSTTFKYGSTQDTYVIFCMAMSVDTYIPNVEPLMTVTKINGATPTVTPLTVQPAQDIEYKIEIRNTGSEALKNVVATIPIPYTASYVNGSGKTVYNFTPNSGAQPILTMPGSGSGVLVCNIGTLPKTANSNDVLAVITYKLRATTDCYILTSENCLPVISNRAWIDAVGTASNVLTHVGSIQGYSATGACSYTPITDPLSVQINAASYVSTHCGIANGQMPPVLEYCNYTGSIIPFTDISSYFPTGYRFYNAPAAPRTEYTAATGFPKTVGTFTYYAVPPGATDCYWAFSITNDQVSPPQVNNITYCVGDTPLPLTATPNNVSNTIYFYTQATGGTATTTITPSTNTAGSTNYWAAEATNGGKCISERALITVAVNSLPVCSINGLTSSVEKQKVLQYSAPAGMQSYEWSISGNGSITAGADTQTVTVNSGSIYDQSFTLTLTVKNSSNCSSTCKITVMVEKSPPPSYFMPNPLAECVNNLVVATYNSSTGQITYNIPEYYIFKPGDTRLDITGLTDDDCAVNALVIHWRIDFQDGMPASVSGTGQLSQITGDIHFPGDGLSYVNKQHKLTYWVEDCNGNSTAERSVTITIKPRPQIIMN